MNTQPATKRSVVLVIVLATVSVACLAFATKAQEKKRPSHKASFGVDAVKLR